MCPFTRTFIHSYRRFFHAPTACGRCCLTAASRTRFVFTSGRVWFRRRRTGSARVRRRAVPRPRRAPPTRAPAPARAPAAGPLGTRTRTRPRFRPRRLRATRPRRRIRTSCASPNSRSQRAASTRWSSWTRSRSSATWRARCPPTCASRGPAPPASRVCAASCAPSPGCTPRSATVRAPAWCVCLTLVLTLDNDTDTLARACF